MNRALAASRTSGDVTRLLSELKLDGRNNGEVKDALYRRIYGELHGLARRHRAVWSGNDTLNTTGLVHEAYLKLVGSESGFENRPHFIAVASRAMRQILYSYADQQAAQKRGGGSSDLPLDENAFVPVQKAEAIVALEEALVRLEAADERAARVVECRFFGGLDVDETATALGVSARTVARDWTAARAWLYGELRNDFPETPS